MTRACRDCKHARLPEIGLHPQTVWCIKTVEGITEKTGDLNAPHRAYTDLNNVCRHWTPYNKETET